MKSFEIYQFLDIIRGESSTNVKIHFLEEFLEDDDFRRIVEYAYNPFITFGIKNIELTGYGDNNFNEDTFELLNKLKDRILTGNEARDMLIQHSLRLNPESAELLHMVLNKDLKAGFGAKSINKAYFELIPTFVYMRSSLPKDVNLKSFDWERGVYSQKKADGMFCNLTVQLDKIFLNTRMGQEFDIEKFVGLHAEAYHVLEMNYQYHGEIVIYENGIMLSRKKSNGIMNHVLKGGSFELNQVPHYFIWDRIPLSVVFEQMPYNLTYEQRFRELSRLRYVNYISLIDTKIVHSYEESLEHYKSMLDQGFEGTILKDSCGVFKNGKSKYQVKLKIEKEAEMRIIDFLPGTGKNKDTFGSIQCVSEDGIISCAASGITDKDRLEIWEHKEDWLDSIVTIRYNEVIENEKGEKSLFLPRYVERRTDRTEASYEGEFE